MWIDHTLKCPDEGNTLQLVRVTSDGKAELVGYLQDEDFYALHRAVETAIRHDDAHGGPSMEDYIARKQFLGWLKDHFPLDE